MRNFLIFLISTFMAADLLAQSQKEIIILHTNDFHGRVQPIQVFDENTTSQTGKPISKSYQFDREGKIGGFAALKAKIEELKSKYLQNDFILVDAGDNFSDGLLGSITKGKANIILMNDLGYDLMALGNHDYDFGKSETIKLDSIADFPILGANVLDSAGNPFLGKPYRTFERNGVKVAILALTYRNTPLTTNPKNITGLAFNESIEILPNYMPTLRDSAELVVLLSHEGIAYDREIAQQVEGVDLIIGGHSHDVTEPAEKIGSTWIVQALSNSAMLGVTRLVVEDNQLKSVDTQIAQLWVDQLDAPKPVCNLIDSLRSPYIDSLRATIGFANGLIARNYKAASPFDILVGQILTEKTGADLALLPGVGYGIALKDTIYREDLHTLLPHPSKLVTLQLTGKQIKTVLEQSATNLKPKETADIVGGMIQTAGIQWEMDLKKPLGERVAIIAINGESLEQDKFYEVATHSGMLSGIHNYNEIAQGQNIKKFDQEIVVIVENYFQENETISAPEQEMIIVVR